MRSMIISRSPIITSVLEEQLLPGFWIRAAKASKGLGFRYLTVTR